MAQHNAVSRIVAGAATIVGLGAVWIAIITNLPSQEELSARVAVGSGPVATESPLVSTGQPRREPVFDLSIPGVPTAAPSASHVPDRGQGDRPVDRVVRPRTLGPKAGQVLRLKCEAEIEQLCPDMSEGPSRARCMERHAQELPLSCQHQLQERFVKWKEDRGRMLEACRDDVRSLCVMMKPGDGRVLACLQTHAQEVSDRCYQTLPKGTLLFRQQ